MRIETSKSNIPSSIYIHQEASRHVNIRKRCDEVIAFYGIVTCLYEDFGILWFLSELCL